MHKNISETDSGAAAVTTDDGFNFLRKKEHLENRAEKLIEKKATGNRYNHK